MLKLSTKTGGRVVHGNDVMPEERVDPPVVVELESRGPIGLGDLVKEPVLEEEPIWVRIRIKFEIHGDFEAELQPFPDVVSKRIIQRAHEELVLVYVTFKFPE